MPSAGPAELFGSRQEPLERKGCLHELFAAAAERTPDRVAVTDGARKLSYRELDLAANCLANKLVRMGAGPEQLVAICAECTADVIIGVLGVLKSGAAYLPLDPSHPVARLEQALNDAHCRILVGDEVCCAPLARADRNVVRLDEPLTGEPVDPPRTAVGPGNTAYVIYTSGSTGSPKGVVVSHANIVGLFTATSNVFQFGPHDVWTLFHSLAFDFSVWEIWGALLHGGRLLIVPQSTRRDPAAFLDLLRREQVTVLNQTPTAFSQLADAADEADFPPLGLRLVICGGEALHPSRLRLWASGYGTAKPALVNMYGITETTVHVTIRTITAEDLDRTASPIGQPMAGMHVHVLTENMTEAPAGTEGDIYVGGSGVSRGYLNRPALSAQRFVPDPFGRAGRLYRTGDRAIRQPDGELEFRGRADSQVKFHGFRIELGEIEHALLDQPGIRAAVCTLREDRPGQPRLVAYLVPATDHVLYPDQVLHSLHRRLPHYMVPAFFVTLPVLPLTPNGKLDRAGLPAPRDLSNRPRLGGMGRFIDASKRQPDFREPG